jgi:glycerophosphoryl diester phosphodiesterase
MGTNSELIAQQLMGAIGAQRIWGDLIINAKLFGAKGDGAADDTTALQAAINHAHEIGKKDIWLPAGTYKYTTLANVDEITFYGDGVTLDGITPLDLVSFRELSDRINNIVADAGDSNSEIVDARKSNSGITYPVLKARLDSERAQLIASVTAETQARVASDNQLSNRIADEEAARIAGDAALNNRISNLIVSGGGDSNPEVIDARDSGPKLTTYPTLKDRLDAGEQDLIAHKADFAKYSMKTINIMRAKNANRFLAHRGCLDLWPENTLISLVKSAQRGYFGLETDIHQTSDGVWVIMHDDTVDRTTDGIGAISSLTIEQIKELKIDAGTNIALYPDLRVPTLEEFLQAVNKFNSFPCIEIKGSGSVDYDSLLGLLEQYAYIDRSFILDFSRTNLEEIRSRNKAIAIMLNDNITSESIDWCASQGNAVISTPYTFVTKELVDEAHEKGVFVVSYSINNPYDAKLQLDMGVDWMTTDGKII